MGRLTEESQGFKPDPGNPAVRDYRGASGNVAMVEMRSRLAYRKSESGNPPPTAGAPELYPNHSIRFGRRNCESGRSHGPEAMHLPAYVPLFSQTRGFVGHPRNRLRLCGL